MLYRMIIIIRCGGHIIIAPARTKILEPVNEKPGIEFAWPQFGRIGVANRILLERNVSQMKLDISLLLRTVHVHLSLFQNKLDYRI